MPSRAAVFGMRVAELRLVASLAGLAGLAALTSASSATFAAASGQGPGAISRDRTAPSAPGPVVVADSLYTAGHHVRSVAILDSLVSAWRAAPPPTTAAAAAGRATPDLAYALVSRGRQLAHLMAARRAHADLDSALTLAEAAQDTLMQCQVLRWHGYAAQSLSLTEEAARHYHRLLQLSQACGNRFYEGFARFGLGYVDLLAGRSNAARGQYDRAIELFHALEKPREELYVLVALGMLLHREGDLKAARACYATIVERSRQLDASQPLLQALNNLALLELNVGDPTLALPALESALDLARRLGTIGEIAMIRTNLAATLAQLENWSDALAAYDSALVMVRQNGLADREATILREQGDALVQLGRRREALTRYEAALARCGPAQRDLAGWIISGLMSAQEDPHAALQLLAQLVAQRYPDSSLDQVFQSEQASLLLRAGRPAASLACAQRYRQRAARIDSPQSRLQALVAVARAHQALEQPDSELVYLQRARDLWEEQRSSPRDPRWREERGALARTFYGRLGELLMLQPGSSPAARRAATAFDALQRFKSRTLIERLRVPRDAALDPGGAPPPPASQGATVTLAALQQQVLRERELLLDLYLGQSTSFLFAVTRDSLRAVQLPSSNALDGICSLTRDLLGTPPDAAGAHIDPHVREAAIDSVAQRLLGPVTDLLQSSSTVFVSPDGCLQGVPFQLLADRLREINLGHAPKPRATGFVGVSIVPSATLLADLRQRESSAASDAPPSPRSTPGSFEMLAVGIGSSSSGRDLPGAVAEVRWLADRFEAVQAYVDTVPRELGAQSLARHDLLHFAAHIQANGTRPWNSAIHLGDAGPTEHTLTASEVAGSRLRARLCVLSGCESAGGRVLWGEGVQSMAAAFLAAGVPAVLATAWPVDDRATQRLMQAFYEELATGATVSEAVWGAQRRMASRADTADPFYWSGLMLIGDGSMRVPLSPRSPLAWLKALADGPRATVASAIVAALLLAIVLLRVRRSARRRWSAGIPPADDAVKTP